MQFKYIDDLSLLVSYQLPGNATDAEWDVYLASLKGAIGSDGFRVLVVTEGGYPSNSQLSKLKTIVVGRVPRVAVLSSAIILRFVVSTLALINRNIKCFGLSQLTMAYSYLEIRATERALVDGVIQELRAQVTSSESNAA